MTVYAYVRVSAIDQNEQSQINAIKNYCKEHNLQIDDSRWFIEKQSGKNIDGREVFNKLYKGDYLMKGDTLIAYKLDRLSRNYDDLKEIMTTLRNKGVNVVFTDEKALESISNSDTLMDKAIFDIFIAMLSFSAELERTKIKERQAEGIKLAKQRGVYKGRQKEYCANSKDPQKRLVYNTIVSELQKDTPVKQIAKKVGVSRTTVYNIKRELQEEEE